MRSTSIEAGQTSGHVLFEDLRHDAVVDIQPQGTVLEGTHQIPRWFQLPIWIADQIVPYRYWVDVANHTPPGSDPEPVAPVAKGEDPPLLVAEWRSVGHSEW